ncbi:TPA: Ail/Lom family outer membrane beta-barrel protein [Escherichia coli]|nr:Ail/Lom family outer membrane beta-barrel protein [Escherichia coli]
MLNQETAKAARTDSGYILRAPRRMRVADAVAQYMRVQELQRIQQQIRQARNSGGIGQQDYLALISEVTAKTRVLTQAEAEATRQKVAFIRQLKEQATRQNLSSSELLRARAAQLGVSSAAEVYIRKMERAGKATHSLGLKSAAARQEIGVLIGELARGNLGALRGSGITLANRAGWIDTLMSPKGMMLGGVIGGITAAVYGLGKAWYDGQKEGEEFNRQLSLTGHYAGVTAGQLWTLSRTISGNGITQHAAAGALAQVVGSGAFRGNDIGMVARAAAQMERSVGQSVSDTINQFKRLKDDPVNAAKSLDNELHFLTATQLEQIRVLGEQGRSSDAARISGAPAWASEHQSTLSAGYLHASTNVPGSDDLNGINVKYRYEFTDTLGLVTSFSYAGDKNRQLTRYSDTRWHEDSVRNRWFSVMAGPSVRVNEWFSAYAMAGVAYSRVSTFSGDYLRVTDNKGKKHDVLTGSDDGRHSNTSLAWGAGVQFNPTESVAIDIAYEGSGSGDWRTDGFIVGVGYKF